MRATYSYENNRHDKLKSLFMIREKLYLIGYAFMQPKFKRVNETNKS